MAMATKQTKKMVTRKRTKSNGKSKGTAKRKGN